MSDWIPTVGFGFIQNDNGEKILHQWWISRTGAAEWRPVPTVSRYFVPTMPRLYGDTQAGNEADKD